MGMTDLEQVLKDFQDHLAPRLDTYEQAIYLYLFRHSRLIGHDEIIVGFKSARRRIACGIGEKGKPMSENTASKKLMSLQKKGCIVILDSTRDGRKVRLKLPSEIAGVIVAAKHPEPPDPEKMDFFEVEANRALILERECHHCFYCLCQLSGDNYVIEHVISRPHGDSSYRNVVAACRRCNNRKKAKAEDWLRLLYREGLLNDQDLQNRLKNIERLRAGELKPPEKAGLRPAPEQKGGGDRNDIER